MLDDVLALTNVLSGLEGVLKIEYERQNDVESTVKSAIENLENTYGISFDKDVFTLQSENQLAANNIDIFLCEVRSALEQLSLFVMLKVFNKSMPFTLKDVNFFGYNKKALLTSFQYLQDKDTYTVHRKDIIPPLTDNMNNINMCTPKRLVIIMLVLDRLGIYEGVSIVASLLYLGGLV